MTVKWSTKICIEAIEEIVRPPQKSHNLAGIVKQGLTKLGIVNGNKTENKVS